jgi:Arc/MetJ-type ribon-helix-helix transcriptional regulator
MKFTSTMNVRVPRQMKRLLMQEARPRMITESDVVREAVNAYLAQRRAATKRNQPREEVPA